MARTPIVPIAFATSRRRVLGTWDRFHLALPFGRGAFLWGEPIEIGDHDDPERARVLVEERMNTYIETRPLRHPDEPVRDHVRIDPQMVQETSDDPVCVAEQPHRFSRGECLESPLRRRENWISRRKGHGSQDCNVSRGSARAVFARNCRQCRIGLDTEAQGCSRKLQRLQSQAFKRPAMHQRMDKTLRANVR